MAVAIFVNWPGITAEQYEKLRPFANWENDPAPGGLFHASALDDEGLHVFDLWESPEAFQNFLDTRINPNVPASGVTTQPDIKVIPVHDHAAPGFGGK